MKFFYHILIIAVIGIALYTARDDVKMVYDRAASYIKKDVLPSITKNNIMTQSDKIASFAKSIITPGALKATSHNDIAIDADSARLSIKGVISLSNKNRTENGNFPTLTENSKLNLSAKIKLDDMFKNQYFEHISPNGTGIADLGDRVSYQYIVIGENLALGNFRDDKALVDAWMASPGHRANILNKNYTEIGVAVGHGMYEGRDTWLAVQHFGLPRSSCPLINEVLQSTINLNQNDIKIMASNLETRKQRINNGAVYEGKTTNEQIKEYNELVATYNQMIIDMKEKVAVYNSQIKAFNSCVTKSTSEASTN